MVNVIDNEARNRSNMMPVGIKIIDDKGNTTHTARTDLGTNYISLESKWFGSSSNNTGGSTGGNTGGGTDSNHPAAGADYYAGSLADGEITQRNLEWAGTDDPTQSNKITFADDPGTKIFGQFDGITILGHIQKTTMTNGTLGAVTSIPINYDPYNAVKDGHFTTTSPYPLYIQTASLPVGQKITVQIAGIGENISGKNVKAPTISFTFNADKTMTIDHTAGYDNDGNSAGATGANYQFVVDTIATFSTQPAVAQLPPSVNLFTGSTSGKIALVGPSEFYENTMDGLNLALDQYIASSGNSSTHDFWRSGFTNYRINLSVTLPAIKLKKQDLIINNVVDITSQLNNLIGQKVTFEYYYVTSYVPLVYPTIDSIQNATCKILNNSAIETNVSFVLKSSDGDKLNSVFNISKVMTYKD
ncbi:hypothetical protein [Companilactobacillus kimchii]|uniref:Uncharacterized protein n=2 Tax=Companilactobacillus kimchii TaxID=2801452 RepID=A0ABR5NQN3_9LACO|nr:hypothetical protein [Companilactobacillus kimchii]KAE9562925.1 hypothetical protein ATN91_01825 [Companilactobacillus kimchii]KRK49963.1 hypothetical protein FC97_GL002349 [Companilactobacillus kimchii DSM 13961 = JCM 10707]OWF31917.1 hypothetical protein LKACC12383_02530 [Companilactobacillus kimchii]GEO48363.1 hypothetical protein LKI01_23620 [Companilactobacillus paralimentarius]